MQQRAFRIIFYSLWAVVMTALTYIVGAAPLKVLREKAGRSGFWTIGVGLCAALLLAKVGWLALALGSLVVLIGIFVELEELQLSFMVSAFLTLVITTLASLGAFAVWVAKVGNSWIQLLVASIETTMKPVAELNPQWQINYTDIAIQLPSIVLILWLGSLYLAVAFEKRLGSERSVLRAELSDFRLPLPVVWMFMLALLGAFGGFSNRYVEAVAVNLMNLSLMLFFLQGIAVVTRFFNYARVSGIWQFLFMFVIIMYLFLAVSLLGLVDFWIDFRTRMGKQTEAPEKFNEFN
jgi:hypothetical protein